MIGPGKETKKSNFYDAFLIGFAECPQPPIFAPHLKNGPFKEPGRM
jgi:hypothetical protein